MKIRTCGTRQDPETRRPFLVEEAVAEYAGPDTAKSPWDVAQIMCSCFHADMMTEEHAWLLALDAQGRPKGVFEFACGTATAAPIDPAAVFMRALLAGAARIILVHNHPTGNCMPSGADAETTERIRKAGQLLNVRLDDHIIVGPGSFFSFRASGLIKDGEEKEESEG